MVNTLTQWWSPQERRFIAEEEDDYFTNNPEYVAIPLLITSGYAATAGNLIGPALDALISPSGASTSLSGFSTIDAAILSSSGYFQLEIDDIDSSISGLSSQIAGDIVNIEDDITAISGDINNLELDLSTLSGLIGNNTSLINSVSGNLQLNINDRVFRSGDTMTGFLTLNADPVNPLHAVTLQFLENADAALSGYLQNEIDNLSTGTGITGPSPVLNRSIVIYDGTSGDFVQDTSVSIDTNDFILTSGIKIGDTSYTPPSGSWAAVLRCGPSEDGLFIKCANDLGRYPLLIEDDDASIINMAVATDGFIGFGNKNPIYGLDVGGFGFSIENDSINTREGSYHQAQQPYRAFIQIDLTIGTDLDFTVNQLPLNASSEVSIGTLFSTSSTEITINSPGLYRIVWSVTAENTGSGGAPRKTIIVDLNRNNGTFIPSSLVGAYTRDSFNSRIASVSNSYIIRTTTVNETVSLRSRNLGTTNGSLPVVSGFLRVELIDGVL